jgi:hypothetical protein
MGLFLPCADETTMKTLEDQVEPELELALAGLSSRKVLLGV